MIKPLTFVIALLASAASLADYPLEVIPMQARLPQEVIPLLQPFVGADGTITGANNQLIVRAHPERVAEIKRILREIDRPPKRLVIHVRQANTAQDNSRGVAVDARAASDNVSVEVGRPGGEADESRLRARIKQAQTRAQFDSSYRVQATEGYPAFIQSGVSVPIRDYEFQAVPGWWAGYRDRTRFRDATGGFYVLPRLIGDQVTLEIHQHLDRPGPAGSFQVQRAESVVRGQVGEWMPLGGIRESAQATDSGIARNVRTRGREDRDIEVLVEVLP